MFIELPAQRPTAAAESASARLRERLAAARVQTDALLACVRPEFLYERPIAERHRLAFYIGHLEAFDRNLLAEVARERSPDGELDRLFAFGIDPIDGGLPQDTPADWPRLPQIQAYRDRVRHSLDTLLGSREVATPRVRQLLHAAIEHRLMHAETLAYLLHQLPFAHKRGQDPAPLLETAPPEPGTIPIARGTAVLGLRDADEFGWDNERPALDVDVAAFEIDRYKVSNRQFLRFVEHGGYDERALWSDADWAWRQSQHVEHPAFWIRDGKRWQWKSMFSATPLPLDAPVYVSHAEASAYARWVGRRLPSEAQWQRAAFGDAAHDPSAAQLREPDARFDPLPVHAPGLVPSASGAVGLRANGWEWTRTPFAALPGFVPFDFYSGYSAPFFDQRHFVLKGGSPRTAACLLRPSFRNWFQPHYPYAYAGFRLVDGDEGEGP